MSDLVIDSSVVAKWILPESDSEQAQRILAESAKAADRLVVLDLAFSEVVNVIWKRYRQQLITEDETRALLEALESCPLQVESARPLLAPALAIAVKYDRAIYDALFVALAQKLQAVGITADEPLFNTIHGDFPTIVLLRNWRSQ